MIWQPMNNNKMKSKCVMLDVNAHTTVDSQIQLFVCTKHDVKPLASGGFRVLYKKGLQFRFQELCDLKEFKCDTLHAQGR